MADAFDYINSILHSKNIEIKTEYDEKGYVPYITNRHLSYFMDCVLYANEMNLNPFLDKKLQYDYYKYSIRPKKRFAKWTKKENNENISSIQEHYNVSYKKAQEMCDLLTTEQLNEIKRKIEKGGILK